MKNETEQQGVSANSVLLPIIAVLAILHLSIIILVVRSNAANVSLSRLMQSSGVYTADATSLLAGSSLLTETVTSFVLTPVTGDGSVNTGPLLAYANELGMDRRGPQVVERFRGYDVGEEALALISSAAENADYLMDAQLDAISLVASVYPLPELPPLKAIPLRELTAEEQALSAEQRLAAARQMILNQQYSISKNYLYQDVTACVSCIQNASAQAVSETTQRIATLRALQWVVMLSIIVILVVNFIVLYRQLILPLGSFVRLIETDESLNDSAGLSEVRLLAGAYNRLLKRREGLEDILRSAAATDALTGLLNRYSFEQYLLDVGQSGGPLAVILLDINYLKQTNDSQGHTAGDQLIRSSAECIRECFGSPDGDNCFRFGGDEFAAVEKNCTPETLRQMTERFDEAQKRYDVSVSWGCAYTEDFSGTTVRELMDEADRQMYAKKHAVHLEQGESR